MFLINWIRFDLVPDVGERVGLSNGMASFRKNAVIRNLISCMFIF